MDAPAHLPRTVDDLAEWSVYADALIEAGDPRGDLIALELQVGARPTAAELARFRAAAGRVCKPRTIGWCLGFARGIYVGWDSVSEAPELLRRPECRYLEEIELQTSDPGDARWRALFAALPPTCTRAVLRQDGDTFGPIGELLPPQIVEVGVRTQGDRVALVGIEDRFEVADLTSCRMSGNRDDIIAAVERTARTRVRVASWNAPWSPRIEVSRPCVQTARSAWANATRTVREIQHALGLLPWAMQHAPAVRLAIASSDNGRSWHLEFDGAAWALVEQRGARNAPRELVARTPVEPGVPFALPDEDDDPLTLRT